MPTLLHLTPNNCPSSKLQSQISLANPPTSHFACSVTSLTRNSDDRHGNELVYCCTRISDPASVFAVSLSNKGREMEDLVFV
ncbi:hypothetical protein KC19_VG021100 [Ceratodon purpureus]|uniref:Uncharacterized protein n=1 Tax=Ceratodon purpureus TaxID=3225 RepID=A0A8T0HL49_CERPU|nr:hypothetical protein KC19_VG021100 [Ceratodon purpureus]